MSRKQLQTRNYGVVMPNVVFDFNAFFEALDSVRENKRVSWKQVAEDVGMSASSLTRLQQGKRVDVDAVGSLSQWADLDVNDYYSPPSLRKEGDPAEEMVSLLRADSKLSSEESSMLQRVIRAAYAKERRST